MAGRDKFTYDFVKKTFEDRGCKLLETEYLNDRVKMTYIAQCGHIRNSNFNNFVRGKGNLCSECRRREIGERRRLGEEIIRNAFESEGCHVLNTGFSTNKSPVRYIALCGHENTTDYNHFVNQKSGRVCSKCSKSITYTIDYVRDKFAQSGCELLSDEYINCKTKLLYKAQCGHESTITFDKLLNDERSALRCRSCHKHTYHDEPSDRDRHAAKEWRKVVYKMNGYTCQACGAKGGRLNAHHLNAYDAYESERFSTENGVTLCEPCHLKFHKAYGFGGNTREQFQEWLEGNTEES